MKKKKIITIIIVICLMYLSFNVGRSSASPKVTVEEAQKIVDEAARASAATKAASASAEKQADEAEKSFSNKEETTVETTSENREYDLGNEETDKNEDTGKEELADEAVASEDAAEDEYTDMEDSENIKDEAQVASAKEESSTESSQEEIVSEDAGVNPKFKKAMDSYEAFFARYATFMRRYQRANATDALSMLAEYTDFLEKYTKAMSDLNSIDQSKLSEADMQYYIKIMSRINKKLAKVLD